MAHEPLTSPVTGKILIEVFGVDLEGTQFIEQTRTVTINRGGGTVALANKLAPDSELIVRNPATNEEAVARVLDLVKDAIFVQVYGFAFLDASVDLWHVEFPEAPPKRPIILECGSCHAVDAVLLNEMETEILEAKKTVRLFCECSQSFTVWRQTDKPVTERRVTERRVAERAADDRRRKFETIEDHSQPGPQERRKQKRTAMKTNACIRCNGTEEIVVCEDVSRGGFRFKSNTAFPVGTPIDVAVPYARSSTNIFVSARVAYHLKESDGIHRHGVMYVKSVKMSE